MEMKLDEEYLDDNEYVDPYILGDIEISARDRRRSFPGERKTYDIKQLWQLSHEILNYSLIGMKETEIATILNITPQTVSNTVNSSLGQQKLAEMRDKRDEVVIKYDPLAEVKKLLPTAINIYKEIMESDSASLSIKKSTADTIVKDICGYEAPKKIDGRFVSANITPYLDELKQRGREAARQCGMLYDGRDDNEEVKEIEETKDV